MSHFNELLSHFLYCLHNSLSMSQGRIQGGRGARAPPIFGKVNFIFFTLYTVSEKIFLKLNFDFIVAEIRGVFGSVGLVCACVCVSV